MRCRPTLLPLFACAWLGCAHRPAAPPRALRSVDDMVRALAAVRGLSLSAWPRTAFLDDAAFADACVDEQRATYKHAGDEAEWRASGRAAAAEASLADECRQITAFYQERRDRVVVRRATYHGLRGPTQIEVLAHELEHAIQAHALPRPPTDGGVDAFRALRALKEGDAVVTSAAFLFGLSGKPLGAAIPRLLGSIAVEEPARLHDERYFDYFLGARFVLELYRRGGFAAVNDAFARPPRSSAEILHIERYLAPPRAAINVASRLPLPAPYAIFMSEPRGEYRVRDLLSYCAPPDEAMRVAGEWDADQYTLSKQAPPAPPMFRWISAWRSDEAAARFAEIVTTQRGCLSRSEIAVAARGRVVVVVGGLDAAARRKHADEVLADVLALPP